MKYKTIFLLLIFTCIMGCPEHNRDNQYDPGNGNFSSPPPCRADLYEGIYDPYTGHLIGVVVAVTFCEKLTRDFPITHVFYEDISERMRIGYGIEPGTASYTIAIYYSGDFPLGDYSLRLYWGEVGIGVCMFSVVPDGNKSRLRGDAVLEAVEDVPEDSRYEMVIH